MSDVQKLDNEIDPSPLIAEFWIFGYNGEYPTGGMGDYRDRSSDLVEAKAKAGIIWSRTYEYVSVLEVWNSKPHALHSRDITGKWSSTLYLSTSPVMPIDNQPTHDGIIDVERWRSSLSALGVSDERFKELHEKLADMALQTMFPTPDIVLTGFSYVSRNIAEARAGDPVDLALADIEKDIAFSRTAVALGRNPDLAFMVHPQLSNRGQR